MDKRLIPYSVHLPESIFNKIKAFAGERKAASLVREAIVSFVEGGDLYNKGWNSGLDAVIKKLQNHKIANALAINGEVVAELIAREINQLRK